MQPLDIGTDRFADEPQTTRAWLETADGSIARGLVDTFSESGAVIRLADDAAPLAVASRVAVRLSFDPTAPTVEVPARVLRILSQSEASQPRCEVEWLPEGSHSDDR